MIDIHALTQMLNATLLTIGHLAIFKKNNNNQAISAKITQLGRQQASEPTPPATANNPDLEDEAAFNVVRRANTHLRTSADAESFRSQFQLFNQTTQGNNNHYINQEIEEERLFNAVRKLSDSDAEDAEGFRNDFEHIVPSSTRMKM